jgi:hypothetical protein
MLMTELRTLDPDIAAITEHLLGLVESFRTTHIQTVAILPLLR